MAHDPEDTEVLQRTVSEEVAPYRPHVAKLALAPRTSRSMDTSVVNGFLFSFLPALEGKWSGGVQSTGIEEQASSFKVSYMESEACWAARKTAAYSGGLAKQETIYLEPIAHGRCRVVCPETLSEMSYEEQSGDLFATLVQRCKLTGALQRMEAWSLQTHAAEGTAALTRTVSLYSGGDLVSHMVSRERKID